MVTVRLKAINANFNKHPILVIKVTPLFKDRFQMARTFLKLLIFFVAYLSVSAEICRFSPKLHEEFFNVPADNLEPEYLKDQKESLKDSLKGIHNFSIPNISAEDCKKAKLIMESYGEAVMIIAFPLNTEEYERNRILQGVTEVAFRRIVNPDDLFPNFMDYLDDFYFYYSSVALIKNSFMRIFKSESDEILQLIGKNQDVLNLIGKCFWITVENDDEIKNLLGSEELASKVIAIKNTIKQKYDQRFFGKQYQYYKNILKSAYDELNIPFEGFSGFSINLVFYLIFMRLQELNCDESFNFIFANHPLAKVANFKENLDLPAILNICKEYFFSRTKKAAPSNLKDDEKLFKDFENLAIPLVNQNVSILSKLPTKLDHPKQPDQLDQPVKPEQAEQPDPTKNQTQDPIPPPPTIDKLTIFLYTSPIWLLIIGVIIFLVHKQLQKRKNSIEAAQKPS
jgi:hypothetical protein